MRYSKLSEEQKDRIMNAASEVFSTHGFEKSSMNDISVKAGLSKSVLFKYFSTKENLYRHIFELSSRSIRDADSKALGNSFDSYFELMRLSVKERTDLFKKYPWIILFSTSAYFDSNPFVKDLVQEELENHNNRKNEEEIAGQRNSNLYKGIRKDISLEQSLKIIEWISKGFLTEYLSDENASEERLAEDYLKLIDIMETILGDNDNGKK